MQEYRVRCSERPAETRWDSCAFSVGDRVLVDSGEAVITHVVSADQVIVRELATGAVHPLPVGRLKPAPVPAAASPATDLSLISQENWASARRGSGPSNRCSKHLGWMLTS